MEKLPTKFDDWIGVFCKRESKDKAEVLKENFKCSFNKFLVEKDGDYKPDACEDQMDAKVAEMGKESSKSGFDKKFDNAMVEAFGQAPANL